MSQTHVLTTSHRSTFFICTFYNTELGVISLCKKLHVFEITSIDNGYLPNSLNTARFVDLSHKKFSNKCSRVKSAFLIFDDKIITVSQISLP